MANYVTDVLIRSTNTCHTIIFYVRTLHLVQFIIHTKKYCAFVGLDNNPINKLHYKMFITLSSLH